MQKPRSYADGPLTGRDFLGEIPAKTVAGTQAFTATDIKTYFHYRYRSGRGVTTVEVYDVDIVAILLPRQCWTRRPLDASLLDHEQGHFDVTQIVALQARDALKRRLRQEPLRITGRSRRLADREVQRRTAELLKPYFTRARAAQKAYDTATAHGRNRDEQRKHRLRQLAELRDLQKKTAVPSASENKVRDGGPQRAKQSQPVTERHDRRRKR